ncbi:DNA-packaging protein [Sphingomonas sp. GlSt437]|uniref:DNA-packaging protein n=1 Tax=Sphingomonas sp. GlSt437 TaxID=3389970 RepID=UPI003A8468EB
MVDRNLVGELSLLPPVQRELVLRSLTLEQRREIGARWPVFAHHGQLAPPGDWRVWMIRAGRGFGKTRAGAEWITSYARDNPKARIALVGATIDDVVSVMIEGERGLTKVARDDEPLRWRSGTGTLSFDSGAQAFAYSAEAPEKLRGPEHSVAWCDELGKWRQGDKAWDNLLLGLRGADDWRVLVTTTPRPTPLMHRIRAMPGFVEKRGATRDNTHLPASFVEAMDTLYGGTRLGRQELDGELLADAEGALWTRAMIEASRFDGVLPAMDRVVVGVDPPGGTTGDACGIVAAGVAEVDGQRRGYVLEDASVAGLSPEGWARAVADCAARWGADRVVAEVNNGGAMVASVLHAVDAGLPVTSVHATRGKVARAEPIAVRYEAGEVLHAGRFPALEDELCGLIAGGAYAGPGRSPDRADALVWALTELLLGKRGVASVKGL